MLGDHTRYITTMPSAITSPRAEAALSPSQLNALARELLEGAFGLVWVEGEISNLSRPASGHLYFSLKDARAQVRCALFRQRAGLLRFRPADGQKVIARARLSLYEPRGDYQLIVESLEPAGEGALRQAFEALKIKLDAEGLFTAERKRSLPRFPRRLALLTSPRGAAVRDVLSVLARRFPLLPVDVVPIAVQGEGAAAEAIAALRAVNRAARHDLILLTRGGGSLEDLQSFNDEALARAIVASAIPVVSAVGHEIDFSISDFVADLRAPTPSAAAELLVPERGELLRTLAQQHTRLQAHLQRNQERSAQRLDRAALRLQAVSPAQRLKTGRERLLRAEARLAALRQASLELATRELLTLESRLRAQHPRARLSRAAERLATSGKQLVAALPRSIEHRRLRLAALGRALNAISPLATLGRGYALLLDGDSGAVLGSVKQFVEGASVNARLHDGSAQLRVLAASKSTD
jgi:exodeoxyribonuclease VII large subunit